MTTESGRKELKDDSLVIILAKPPFRRADSPLLAVATFVFFARAAGAGIVAADLVAVALGGSLGRGLGFAAVSHHHLARTLLLNLLDVLLLADLDRKSLLDHVLLHHAQHRLEHREAFLLIFGQRIFLR